MSEANLPRVAVVAAAGKGTRFGGPGPKVLAKVGGKPSLQRVLEALEEGLGEHEQVIVIGHEGEAVRAAIGEAPHRTYVTQDPPRGTGDALLCALRKVPHEAGSLYFFCGDKPLLRGRTVRRFRETFEASHAEMLFLTGQIEGDDTAVRDNRQGRVVWVQSDGAPHALAIVERQVIDSIDRHQTFELWNGAQHTFTKDQLLGLREVNVSTYAWSLEPLRRLASELSDDNPQHEVLVTDLVQVFLRHHLPVQTMALTDPLEGKGIDTVPQWQEIRDR